VQVQVCRYAQLVDRLDSGELLEDCQPPFDYARCCTYEQLYKAVSKALFRAHVEGALKEEVMQDPSRFMNTDPAFAQTLLAQRYAGKKLALITNSDWVYTRTLMSYAYDSFLPEGMSWQDLFHLVVVSAYKPEFFTFDRRPCYEIVTEDGMLCEDHSFEGGKAFSGGCARMVEKLFGVSGSQVLYVGDHIFTDVNMAKRGLSWRTCLILQELEAEVDGLDAGRDATKELLRLIRLKDEYANVLNVLQSNLDLMDAAANASGAILGSFSAAPVEEVCSHSAIEGAAQGLRAKLLATEQQLSELLMQDGSSVNTYWGYLTRAGFGDKSHLLRQIEKYADIYTSRVSNLLRDTPHKHYQCGQQSLAHDLE